MHEFGTCRDGKRLVHFLNSDRSLYQQQMTYITQTAIGQIKAGQQRFPGWIWFIELDSGDLIGARTPKGEHDGDIVLCGTTPAFVIDGVIDDEPNESRTVETFELCGNDKNEYFDEDDDIKIQYTDRVLVTLNYTKKVATWLLVPDGENPSNYVPTEDDYDGVINWLVEHGYSSEELIQARRNQLGLQIGEIIE